MRRREFAAWLGAAALTWPLRGHTQRSAIPLIGFLNSGAAEERASFVETFRQALKEGGYVEGKNVAIEYRWAEGHRDRLRGLAKDLVDRKVALIVAIGGIAPGLAAKSVTSTIPIIFTGSEDPVKLGLVASLSRPGGNATGITNTTGSLEGKRLEILKDLLPGLRTVAYLMNPTAPGIQDRTKEVRAAAKASEIKIEAIAARTEGEIDAAFLAMKQAPAQAVLVAPDPFFVTRREQIVTLAEKHAIPAAYPLREFSVAGGLLSYGPDIAISYRQAGIYAALILKGAKPADLPVIQASKIELVLNLKASKALRLAISRDFLARVNEVIE